MSLANITDTNQATTLLVDRNNPNRADTGLDRFTLKEMGVARINSLCKKVETFLKFNEINKRKKEAREARENEAILTREREI